MPGQKTKPSQPDPTTAAPTDPTDAAEMEQFLDEPEGGQEEAEAAAEEPAYVRYTGQATQRVLTADEFEAAGVADQDTLVWDDANGKKVYIAGNINDAALERLGAEPDFEIVQ